MTVNAGHGRIEWRGIQVLEVTPEQMGFPHAVQLARVDRIRELKGGKQEVQTVWIITSLTTDQADAGCETKFFKLSFPACLFRRVYLVI